MQRTNGKVIVISSDSYEDADFEDYVVVAVLLEYLDLFAVLASSGSVVNLINY